MKSYEFLIPIAILSHLLLAPHTKVEESFSLQATHDILVYGTPITSISARLHAFYDHISFPGAVPRSFIGPVLLAGFANPLIALAGFDHAQTLVRALLGLANAAALIFYGRRLAEVFGEGVARWFCALVATQFHVVFYASRTLPNMFAFPLTTVAFACLLPDKKGAVPTPRRAVAISLIVFAGVIWRAELAILLVTQCGFFFFCHKTSLWALLKPVLMSATIALVVSVPVDSYFWQKPLWPELWGFYFNAVQGSSSLWGTEPWYWYFTLAMPRMILNPWAWFLMAVALYQPATRKTVISMVGPTLAFVAIYSLQPHKELRFIIYIVPPLTGAAALGAFSLSSRWGKSPTYKLLTLATLSSTLASFAGATWFLLMSSLNYPGGDALQSLYKIAAVDPYAPVKPLVHNDVLSCMTGITLFLENPLGAPKNARPMRGLVFDKTEDPSVMRNPLWWDRFDYILMEAGSMPPGRWEVVATVRGYAGVEVIRPGIPVGTAPWIVGKGAVVQKVRNWILERSRGWWVGPKMEDKINILRREGGARGIYQY